jgi:hypothetical protein
VVLIKAGEKSGFSIDQRLQLRFPEGKVKILNGTQNPSIGMSRENSNER